MKNITSFLVLAFWFIGSLNLNAQIKQANFLFEQFKYSKAIPLYKKAYEDKDVKVKKEAIVRLADCYRLMNNVNEARSWYAKAITFKDVDSINYYYLGMALRTLANYNEAEIAFANYAKRAPSDFRGKIYAQFCRNIKQWEGLTPSAEIKNASILNTAYSEFGAMYYKDGVILTSDRDVDMMNDKNYQWTSFGYLDLYFSQPSYFNDFWSDMSSPTKMTNTFNQPYHDGPACFSNDQNTIYTTRTLKNSTKKDSTNVRTDLLKIFYADLNNEKKIVYKPFIYNSEEYSVGHPAISSDGKTLIFSSNKPNGFGQSDLYISQFINGEWSNPTNLGENLNTFGNEVFPFMANDSTLFFSSDGHMGFGGLDIFETNIKNGKWTKPWNLKLPINSPYDDFSLVFSKSMTDGFFSSNRPGGVGYDDIYAFKNYRRILSISEDVAPEPIVEEYSSPDVISSGMPKPMIQAKKSAMISGFVKNKATNSPLDSATVFILNTNTNSVLVLKTNSDGYFETPITKDDFYVAKAMKPDFFDDCLNFRFNVDDQSNNLKIPRDLLLDKYALNQVFQIENIYYDLDKWYIREDAKPPLDNLLRILKQYPISIELGSHTDSRASFQYNIELSQKRAESAVRYLTSNGINSGRLTAKGYGETMLVNKCSDGVPCSDTEHQANRRTEFKITAINAFGTNKKTFNPNIFNAGDKIPIQLLDSDFFNGCLENKNTSEKGDAVPSTDSEKTVVPSEPLKTQIPQQELTKVRTIEVMKQEESVNNVNSVSDETILFAVQLIAATNPIKIIPTNFKGEQSVHEKKIGAYHKYYTSSFDNLSKASEERKRLITKFPGAFVVAFKGDQPIPVDVAIKLLQTKQNKTKYEDMLP